MTSRVIRTTRLACALAALGASLSAHAQTGHVYCVDEANFRNVAAADDIAAHSPYANGCIRDLSDGRAAVLLPSALEPISRVPANESLRRHAWGFLDQNGRLAIRPIFEDVRDFRQGLAAVQWQGKWGFINVNGRMAVPPRYDSVGDFAEIGLAVVTLDGRQQLINRNGESVGEPLDAGIQSLVLNDGVPAQASVQYKQEYRSPTGERRFAKPGITVMQAYGDGLYIAMNDEHQYGVLDRDWNWLIEPVFEDVSNPRDGMLAVAYGRDGVMLLGADGKLIGEDQHYEDLNAVGRKFWSANLGRGKGYAILDAAGTVIVTMTQDEAQASQRFTDTILYPSNNALMALVPGQAKPVTLGQGILPANDEGGFVLFRNDAGEGAGLLTPKGAWLHGESAPAWLAEAGAFEVRLGRLWIMKREGGLLNIVDADGQALLKPEAVEAVQSMTIKALPLNIPGAPLGTLGQSHCQCGPNAASLLLADGSIVTDPKWTDLVPLDGDPESSYGDEPVSPDTLKPEQLRYAAETADGMQLLDAQGRPMKLPLQQHIGRFYQGYALVYADGVNRMIDRDGKVYALPADVFDSHVVAPGVIRYVKTASDDAPWCLYDFVAGKELAAPAFRDIGEFQHGQAVATLGEGRAGVIDLQGKWIVPARHQRVERINDKLWKVMQAGGQEDDYGRAAAVFNDQGRALTPFVKRLQLSQAPDGAITVDSEQRRWIFSADGAAAVDLEDATYTRLGDWLEIRRATRYGYLDAQGKWQIAPSAAVGSVFHGSPARALVTDENATRLIDAQGKTVATLPEGDWRWPQGSSTLLRHVSTRGRIQTDYVDMNGKTTLQVEGMASAYSEGRAVTILATRAVRAVDAKGALTGPAFDALGTMRDGLAPALSDYTFGYVNREGTFVIPQQYSAVTPFTNQRAVVSTMEASELIDPAGQALARVEMVCGVRTLYGSAGQRLWPNTMPARCEQHRPK